VQRVLGHKSIKSTQRYAQISHTVLVSWLLIRRNTPDTMEVTHAVQEMPEYACREKWPDTGRATEISLP
jgi:hypothetical protein